MTLFSGASGFEINGGDFSVVGGDYIDMSLPPSPNPPVQPANYGYNQFPSRYSEMTSGPEEYSTTGQAYGQPANTQNAWVPHQHYQNLPVNNVMTAEGTTRAHQPNNMARNGNTAGPNEVHHQAILRMPQPITFPVPETEINRQTQPVGSSPVLVHVTSQNDLSHPVASTSPEAAGPRGIASIPAENTTPTDTIAAGETPMPETKRSTPKIFRKIRSIFTAISAA
ncbi:hypothetical protein BDN70DRAFT_363034 [Pholiota conissans]|uniref:Uncharacterized protein n=1 Tax=Pholiota conissans TaxID=109636 RepID=A0A9P5YRC8_9AGAR|nr:hypothetical protein BDN70DRAFT_363034 [Pholiota conissans]